MRISNKIRALAFSIGAISAGLVLPTTIAKAQSSSCPQLNFFGVRESGTPQDPDGGMGATVRTEFIGMQNRLAGKVTLTGSGLVYPAASVSTLTWGQKFLDSVEEGRNKLLTRATEFAIRCPLSKLAFGGYSQGALIIRQAIPALSQKTRSQILAVTLFGDPSYSSGDGMNHVGGAPDSSRGVYEAVLGSHVDAMPAFNGVRASWCYRGDAVCNYSKASLITNLSDAARGGPEAATHGKYRPNGAADEAGLAIADAALAQLFGAPTSTVTPAPSPTPAPTPGASQQGTGVASVRVAYTGGIGVWARYAPTLSAQRVTGPREGETYSIICQTEGEAVGSRANRLWNKAWWNNGVYFFPDEYSNSPMPPNQYWSAVPRCSPVTQPAPVVTPAPVTSASVTPAPVTPAPVTPPSVTPAPVSPTPVTQPQATQSGIALGVGSNNPTSWQPGWDPTMGTPANTVHPWDGGCIQDLRGGSFGDAALMQKGCSGNVFAVTGSVWQRLVELRAENAGYPLNGLHPWGTAMAQDFDGGIWGWNIMIVPSRSPVTFNVRGAVLTKYLELNGITGRLGAPVSSEYQSSKGPRQDFVGGSITWTNGEAVVTGP